MAPRPINTPIMNSTMATAARAVQMAIAAATASKPRGGPANTWPGRAATRCCAFDRNRFNAFTQSDNAQSGDARD